MIHVNELNRMLRNPDTEETFINLIKSSAYLNDNGINYPLMSYKFLLGQHEGDEEFLHYNVLIFAFMSYPTETMHWFERLPSHLRLPHIELMVTDGQTTLDEMEGIDGDNNGDL